MRVSRKRDNRPEASGPELHAWPLSPELADTIAREILTSLENGGTNRTCFDCETAWNERHQPGCLVSEGLNLDLMAGADALGKSRYKRRWR